MSFNIISSSYDTKTAIVSFHDLLDPVEITIPEEFWQSTRLVRNKNLDTYINSLDQKLTPPAINTTSPIKVYVPPYLTTNNMLMSKLNTQVALNQITLMSEATKNETEYVIYADWSQDIIVHDSIRAPDSDCYIYVRNRMLLLQHLNNLINNILPEKSKIGEVDLTHAYPVSTKFVIPKSTQELANFLTNDKQYTVSNSLVKPNLSILLSMQQVIDMFTPAMFQQNQQARNVCSMDDETFIVEEARVGKLETIIVTVSRPVDDGSSNYRFSGTHVHMYNKHMTDGVFKLLSWLVNYTFFHFGAHVSIEYYLSTDSNNKSVVNISVIDVGINEKHPKISGVYCA